MHIAIIVRRLDRASGVERLALSLGRALTQRGHRITYYTFYYDRTKLFPDMRDLGPVVALNQGASRFEQLVQNVPVLSACVRAWCDTRRAHALALRIDPTIDLLNPHDHGVYQVAAYFKRYVRTVPSVWVMDDMPTRRFGQMRREACGEKPAGLVRRVLNASIDKIDYIHFIRTQDRIAVLDDRDREWVRKYFGKDARVIRSGTNLEQFPYRARTHASDPVNLLMTGIFFPHRRFEDAIAALALLHAEGIPARLNIAGQYRREDPYVQKILRLIQELHVDASVKLLGRVSDEELVQLYQEADLFLFPNHLQSWGLAVFEALSSGLPAIVSTSAGAAEVLHDRETALLVPPKNPQALKEAVVTLCKDRELYRRLSLQGRHLVAHEMTWQHTAEQFEDLCKNIHTL